MKKEKSSINLFSFRTFYRSNIRLLINSVTFFLDNMSRSRSNSRDRERERKRDSRKSDKRSRSRDRSTKEYVGRKRSRERKIYGERKRSHSRERYAYRRSRDKSHGRRSIHNSRDRSFERKSNSLVISRPVKPIIITTSSIKHRSKAEKAALAKTSETIIIDHRKSFEISNEFSQDGFEQFSRDHGIDFSKVETEEDKLELHEKMNTVLKEYFAAQGKVYPPTKPEVPAINAATGFANDGSFLEQFKKMQEEYQQQIEEGKRRKAAENRLNSLPLRRRGGGKILKTGVVAKNVASSSNQQQTQSGDAFSLYFNELQKYKNTSCEGETNARSLVK